MKLIHKLRNAYEKAEYNKKGNKIDDFFESFFLAFLTAAVISNLLLISELVKTLELIFKGLEIKGVI